MGKQIAAGELNRHITLIKFPETADGRGGRKRTPVTVATVWAKFLVPRFAEEVTQGGLSLLITQGVEIRKRTDIERGWRVKEGTRTYDVIHVDRSSNYKTVLTLKEVVH
jgi:SPP1 family predicted phage head-tail adaptor